MVFTRRKKRFIRRTKYRSKKRRFAIKKLNKRIRRQNLKQAELKYKTVVGASAPTNYTNPGANNLSLIRMPLIQLCFPAEGTDKNQFIGNKLFIKNIKYVGMVHNNIIAGSAKVSGLLGVIVLKEKVKGILDRLAFADLRANGNDPWTSWKHDLWRYFSFAKLYTKKITFASSEVLDIGIDVASNNRYVKWRFNFKINKNCRLNGDIPSIKEIWVCPVHFVAPYTLYTAADNFPPYEYRATMFYKDI